LMADGEAAVCGCAALELGHAGRGSGDGNPLLSSRLLVCEHHVCTRLCYRASIQ
jgi:hypothetical protein